MRRGPELICAYRAALYAVPRVTGGRAESGGGSALQLSHVMPSGARPMSFMACRKRGDIRRRRYVNWQIMLAGYWGSWLENRARFRSDTAAQ